MNFVKFNLPFIYYQGDIHSLDIKVTCKDKQITFIVK